WSPRLTGNDDGNAPQLFVLSAETTEQLYELAANHEAFLGRIANGQSGQHTGPRPSPRDVALTLQHGRKHCDIRLAITAPTLAVFQEVLADFIDRTPASPTAHGQSAAAAWWFGDVTNKASHDDNANPLPLDQFAAAWVTGQARLEQPTHQWNRVPLPGYVFKRRRYWVEEQTTQEARPQSESLETPPPVARPYAIASPFTDGPGAPLISTDPTVNGKHHAPGTKNGQAADPAPVAPMPGIARRQLAPADILALVQKGELQAGQARELLQKIAQSV
ncbi:MAG: hypothetical protein AAFO75_09665, partial [Pseudomonadota bacterium]